MEDEDSRTIWCGNLHEKTTEDILYELFMQGGPVQKISIPKDRDGRQKNFGFVTYKHACSVPYALELFDGTTLFNRTLNLKSRNNNLENIRTQQPYMQREMEPCKVQNELLLGQQILLGAIAPMNFAMNNSFMLPGQMSYASQNSLYPQDKGSPSEYSRSNNKNNRRHDRNHDRNHPYNDRNNDYDRYNNRNDNRNDSRNRDHKSHRHSSHRSHRHDNRRNYR